MNKFDKFLESLPWWIFILPVGVVALLETLRLCCDSDPCAACGEGHPSLDGSLCEECWEQYLGKPPTIIV